MQVAEKEVGLLLTIEQVADRLQVCSKTVDNRSRAGDMPAPVRIGRKILRWDARKLDEWLANGCPRTEEAANAQ